MVINFDNFKTLNDDVKRDDTIIVATRSRVVSGLCDSNWSFQCYTSWSRFPLMYV